MFNRKPKTSHKNDEIFVDFSKDVDVKKTDEEEAVPEHYEALKVTDEVVVSKSQITEAMQQKAQEEFILERTREIAKQKEKDLLTSVEQNDVIKEDTTTSTPLDNVHYSIDDQPLDEPLEEDLEEIVGLDQSSSDLHVNVQVQQNDDSPTSNFNYDDYLKQNRRLENEIPENEKDQRIEHRLYPSFLHDELSVRRKMEPLETEKDDKEYMNQDDTKVKDVEIEDKEIEDKEIEDKEIEDKEIEDKENIIEEPISPAYDLEDEIEKKQDLHSFFGVDSSVLKQGTKKRKRVETKRQEDTQNKPLYQFKHHKFYSLEEFTTFLSSNYERLDEIAVSILRDERFFRWLKEESNQFEESIVRMKKIKQELKQ